MKLLTQVRHEIRFQQLAYSTEKTYCYWIKRYCQHYNYSSHPVDMGEEEVKAFLTHLAVEEFVSASTQNQAFASLIFLYRHVLKKELKGLEKTTRAKEPQRVPVVMSHEEAMKIIDLTEGIHQLISPYFMALGSE